MLILNMDQAEVSCRGIESQVGNIPEIQNYQDQDNEEKLLPLLCVYVSVFNYQQLWSTATTFIYFTNMYLYLIPTLLDNLLIEI